MFKRTDITNKIMRFLCLVLCMMVLETTVSYAAESWRPEDSVIYEGREDAQDKAEDVISAVGDFLKDLGGGVLGLFLSPLFITLGDVLYTVLQSGGIAIDAIVFGRVGNSSHATGGIAYFTYELTQGNIYGTISMWLYNILMFIFIVILICVVLYRLVALIYTGADAKSRSQLKETVLTSFLSILAIYLMPKVLDLVLYIRDLILYEIMQNGFGALEGINDVSGFFSGTGSILYLYRNSSTGNLFNSIMYFAMTVLTLYFAFCYVSVAISFSLLVVLFPLTCVLNAAAGGKKIAEWANEILGLAIIPVIDAILLMFPIIVNYLTRNSGTPGPFTLLQFVMCSVVIPARQYVRSKLGFGSDGGLERAGAGSLIGAVGLAASLIGAAKGIGLNFGKKNEAAEKDVSMAEAHSLIAKNKSRASAQAFSSYGEESGKSVTDEMANASGYSRMDTAKFEESLGGRSDREKNGLRRAELMSEKVRIDNSIENLEGKIKDNESESAAWADRLRTASRKMKDPDASAVEKAGAAKAADEARTNIERLDKKNKEYRGYIQKFQNLKRQADGKMVAFNAVDGGDEEGQARLDAAANIANFELPEFRNMSEQRKSELYRVRARATRQLAYEERNKSILGTAVGSAGGAAMSTFMGVKTGMVMTNIGSKIGEAAGEGSYAKFEGKVMEKEREKGRETLSTPYTPTPYYSATPYAMPPKTQSRAVESSTAVNEPVPEPVSVAEPVDRIANFVRTRPEEFSGGLQLALTTGEAAYAKRMKAIRDANYARNNVPEKDLGKVFYDYIEMQKEAEEEFRKAAADSFADYCIDNGIDRYAGEIGLDLNSMREAVRGYFSEACAPEMKKYIDNGCKYDFRMQKDFFRYLTKPNPEEPKTATAS